MVHLDRATTVQRPHISLEWTGVPVSALVANVAEGVAAQVRWYAEDGTELDSTTQMRQGTTFWAKLTARKRSRQSLDELALVMLLPAGWEAENTRLTDERPPDGLTSNLVGHEEYVDLRDDRIVWFFDMSAGTFTRPPILLEAMYDRSIRVTLAGEIVRIVGADAQIHEVLVERIGDLVRCVGARRAADAVARSDLALGVTVPELPARTARRTLRLRADASGTGRRSGPAPACCS